MDKVAAEQKVPLSEIAIAWMLQKPFVTSAIASATNEKQLKELINATNLKLTSAQMKQLDEASNF
jgi:aryl-alcohol dehydrogenase-like predicted oxidoreductase